MITPIVMVLIMVTSLFVLIVAGVEIPFALIGSTIPVVFIDNRILEVMLAQKIYTSLNSFVLLAVPFFLLAGNLMNSSKLTDRLIELSYSLIGHIRGGLAQINVIVSLFFAGISGSSTADTAGIGSVLIPSMKERGYPASFSVAITAASSVLGTIIPPSILLVVWGALTNTSVSKLFAAGIIPGIIVAAYQMLYVDFSAKKYNFPKEPNRVRDIGTNIRRAILPLLMPVFIIGSIMFGVATPTEAAVIAVLYALFLGIFIYRTLTFSIIRRTFIESIKLAGLSLFCLGSAGLFGWIISYYRIPYMIVGLVKDISSPLLLLTIIAFICLVLGMFLDGLVVATIIGPLFIPAILAVGINPVHYGIVASTSIAIGLITPPYGLCLLIGASIGEIPVHKTLLDIGKMLLGLIVVLGILIFIPGLSTWIPGLIS